MKKAILCALAVAAGLVWNGMNTVQASAAEEAAQEAAQAPRAVEVKAKDRMAQEKMDYVQSDKVFETATLRHDTLTESYRLSKYDTINILVVGFPDGIGVDDITVGTDGYVQLPYAGSVKLAGLTLDEAKQVLMDALGRYIRIPDMSILIKSYGPRRVYVMGEVKNPGIHDMNIDNLNAYAAITAAGGYTKRSRSTRVQVIRVIDNTMYYEQLNMKNFIRRHDLTQNVKLQDGDIIYVPKSNGIRWDEDILPYFNAWALYKGLTD